jgi:LCP family protein required for cell wall assembly
MEPGNDVSEVVTPVKPKKNGEKMQVHKINLLLLGIDAEEGPKRSDTMMVFSYDPDTNEGAVISIPRDTRVNIPGHGIGRVNGAHAHGGAKLAIQTISEFLDIPIHYYISLNYDGFTKIINEIGGVEIFVERDMKYDDFAGGLHIDIKKGLQVMDGKKALEYVRFRGYQDADIGRINTQQKFLKALAREMLKLSNVIKIPKIAAILPSNIKTNMKPDEILGFANEFRHVKFDDIKMVTIPGESKLVNGAWYYFHNREKTIEIINELVWNIDKNKNLDITVSILNGTKDENLGKKIARDLENLGFQIKIIGVADVQEYDTTVVVDHRGNKNIAMNLTNALREVEYLKEVDPDSPVDFTVIVGLDRKNNY